MLVILGMLGIIGLTAWHFRILGVFCILGMCGIFGIVGMCDIYLCSSYS